MLVIFNGELDPEWSFCFRNEPKPEIVETRCIDLALAQPVKICSLPTQFNNPNSFFYRPQVDPAKVDQFDIHLFSSVEVAADDLAWFNQLPYKHKFLLCGYNPGINATNIIFRPWWMLRVVSENYLTTHHADIPAITYNEKPYYFDCLLGNKKRHRNFVFREFSKHDLLAHSMVSYRKSYDAGTIGEFNLISYPEEGIVSDVPEDYVSPHFLNEFEVDTSMYSGGKINSSHFSCVMPKEVYSRTHYSVVTETLVSYHTTPYEFITEKTGKPLLAKRLFVMFGQCGILKTLHELGFETFGDVIDESYDQEEDEYRRMAMAFNQVLKLHQLSPEKVFYQVRETLEYNCWRLYELRNEIQHKKMLWLSNAVTAVMRAKATGTTT